MEWGGLVQIPPLKAAMLVGDQEMAVLVVAPKLKNAFHRAGFNIGGARCKNIRGPSD